MKKTKSSWRMKKSRRSNRSRNKRVRIRIAAMTWKDTNHQEVWYAIQQPTTCWKVKINSSKIKKHLVWRHSKWRSDSNSCKRSTGIKLWIWSIDHCLHESHRMCPRLLWYLSLFKMDPHRQISSWQQCKPSKRHNWLTKPQLKSCGGQWALNRQTRSCVNSSRKKVEDTVLPKMVS